MLAFSSLPSTTTLRAMFNSLQKRARHLMRHAALLSAAAAIGLLNAACGSAIGPFVWANDFVTQSPGSASGAFTVGVGDLVSVQVFDNDKLSVRGRVRADGMLSVPLLNDVPVAGRTPQEVGADVAKRLRDQNLVLNPRVNVSVEDVPAVKISVIGSVAKPGNYAVDQGSGVAEALAGAGGLTDFAHKDRIFVVRKLPIPVRIRFTFQSLTDTGAASKFRMQQGDIIVVE